MTTEQPLDILTYNKNALNKLRRAVVLGQGQFSLILARVNYRQLRQVLLAELGQQLQFTLIPIAASATRLRDAMMAEILRSPRPDPPQALMVTGLEEIRSLDQLEKLLKAANLGRDELPKTFHTPVVLWVNDTIWQQLNRYAPDLKRFAATPIRFEYPISALIAILTAQANDTFRQILAMEGRLLPGLDSTTRTDTHLPPCPHIVEPLTNRELSFAIAQIAPQESRVSNELLANLLFLQGRNLHQQGELLKARDYYESSLSHWQQNPASADALDKQAVLLLHLGLWWRSQAVLNPSDSLTHCQQAQRYFEDCLAIFRQQNRADYLAKFSLPLAEVLHKREAWSALAAIAQEGTELHAHDPICLARDYGYLAEAALARYVRDLQPDFLEEAKSYAQRALAISQDLSENTEKDLSADLLEDLSADLLEDLSADLLKDLSVDPLEDLSADLSESPFETRSERAAKQPPKQTQPSPLSAVEKAALRYHRGTYWYVLAQVQQFQNESLPAIENLEKARSHTHPRYDLTLYRRILDKLWHLYFSHKQYAQAFEIKLAQRRIESRFGLRAFIGASQIQPISAIAKDEFSDEFSDEYSSESSGEYLSESSGEYTLELTPNAATDQALAAEIRASGRQQDIEALLDRLSQPGSPLVVIHGQSGVGKSSILSAGLMPRLRRLTSEGRTTHPILINSYFNWAHQLQSALPPIPSSDSFPLSPSPPTLTQQLQALTQANYQQIVLIFDQYEDFFYEYPAIEQRRDLYAFLRDCLNLPYVKVVLSLREDFLHYLLEWDRNADLSMIENDILGKEIRYYLGNFKPKAAESVIFQLTQAAGFYLESGLITALVDDLAADTGEVRPIELQVVGAQLQRENITTLAAYRQLGRSPKSQLLKNFLESVIRDCGLENERVAQSVLYLLSEGIGRPLKSYSEIAEALTFTHIASEPQQLQLVLDILVGSGLIFAVPEVSGVRYQLVHEYLASLVQQQPPAGSIETGEVLKTERSRRQDSESQLQAALAAQSASLAQITLARQRTQLAEIKALIAGARSLLLAGDGLAALAKALRAARSLDLSEHSTLLKMQAVLCLEACLRTVRASNELVGHNHWILAVDCSFPEHAFPKDALTENALQMPERLTRPQIVSASEDGTIKLWSFQGDCLCTLAGHSAGVVDIRFSPDGNMLASAGLDHTIRLWRTNGDFIRSLEIASASVISLCFSPTEPLLAATYSDSHVRLWNIQSGTLVSTFTGHEDWARTVAFSPDGQLLATGGEDQTVRLWSVAGELLNTLRGHQGWVRSVAFSPDGQKIISAGDANTLRLWSVDGRKLKTLYGHENWVRSVAFSPDGQRIASASDDQTIKIWGIEGTIQQTFNQRSSVHSLAWCADSRSLVSGGDDERVHIWQLEGSPQTICRAHTGIAWSARWQPSLTRNNNNADADNNRHSNRFLSAGGDDTIRLWSETGALLKSISGHRRGVHCIAWSPAGDFFASASADHSVRLWTAEGELVRSLIGHQASVWQVSYSPDGTRIASVSSDRTIRLWSSQGELLNTWDGHTDTLWHVSFSPDSQYLITASEDNTLRLWHLDKGLIQTLQGHDGGVWCARFSPDARYLASGGADGMIRLWSISEPDREPEIGQAREQVQQLHIEPNPLLLKGHRDWVRSLSFSAKGEWLASASDDGTVRLWSLLPEALESFGSSLVSAGDTYYSQLLPPLTGSEGVIWDVDFEASGERLVTASADGTVRVWDLRLDVLMEKGCDWLKDWLRARPKMKAQLCRADLETSF